jgi:L-aminopeptidase/D-esterase-like protein
MIVDRMIKALGVLAFVAATSASALAATPHPRARALGVPFDGTPGRWDAITDVPGVEVGETTLIRGSGRLHRGQGPVRTGVTVIFPLGRNGRGGVAAGHAVINGTGEWTGLQMVEELGLFFGPIALTGTGNIGVVHQALVDWAAMTPDLPPDEVIMRSLPLVGETLDMPLNDVFGHPLRQADVFAALRDARSGPVIEGNVGGGTGMIAYGFKGGTGTASRVVNAGEGNYTLGVLLQSNHGRRADLRIAGIPIGQEIADLMPQTADPAAPPSTARDRGKNSILIVIATNAPLDSAQLRRLARRAALGLGRNGGTASDLSGEFALAFSTTYRTAITGAPQPPALISALDEPTLNRLFEAAVQAVEEAEVNQLVASETMVGADGSTVFGLPTDRLRESLIRHARLASPH